MSATGPQLNSRLFNELSDVSVFTESIDLLGYRRDASVVDPGIPQAVIRPNSVVGVQQTIRLAERERMPVYLRGGGSMYAGGVNPHAGGIVLDMCGLDRIIDIDLDRGLVVVEPGVRFGALLKALAPHCMTIGIVPLTGPTATVGGAASAHALGTGSVRFQSFAEEVAGLEVVLSNGEKIRTGSAASKAAGFFHRHCFGPDLTGLFLGADATMGVITALALWLHPIPEKRQTFCVGFNSIEDGARCIAALQNQDRLQDVWYASCYEAAAIQGRLAPAFPDRDPSSWPNFALGLDIGGSEEDVTRSQRNILDFCATYAGENFQALNEVFFKKLRYDETFWYAYAGYFTRSRSGLLMTSLPSIKLADFYTKIAEYRDKYPDFMWAGGAILCRRGLHAGVITFYDEQTQWHEMQEALTDCASALIKVGCVPYKSGKIWAEQLIALGPYYELLGRIKTAMDPGGILGPGNLGLRSKK